MKFTKGAYYITAMGLVKVISTGDGGKYAEYRIMHRSKAAVSSWSKRFDLGHVHVDDQVSPAVTEKTWKKVSKETALVRQAEKAYSAWQYGPEGPFQVVTPKARKKNGRYKA